MAIDNHPKARQREQLARKQGKRASHDRILIVSEGSKTEPNYFNEIRQELRLPTANIQIHPSELGTEPIQVVEYAEKLLREGCSVKRIQKKAFEQVYVVFDRDEHRSYHQALDKATALNEKIKNDNKQAVHFHAIASVPSFELWLLLHFENIQHNIHRHEVLRRLKQHFPGYEKGSTGSYTATKSRFDEAQQRALALAHRFDAHSGTDPYTAVHELVSMLHSLGR